MKSVSKQFDANRAGKRSSPMAFARSVKPVSTRARFTYPLSRTAWPGERESAEASSLVRPACEIWTKADGAMSVSVESSATSQSRSARTSTMPSPRSDDSNLGWPIWTSANFAESRCTPTGCAPNIASSTRTARVRRSELLNLYNRRLVCHPEPSVGSRGPAFGFFTSLRMTCPAGLADNRIARYEKAADPVARIRRATAVLLLYCFAIPTAIRS